ncbi:MAG: sulfatase [Kiritimatiellia bacterium]|nr:sulfatase [Kiritimatiellia bacterium]
MRRMLLRKLFVGLCVVLMACCFASMAEAEKGAKPNFIIIFTDDQGYQDLGCFGSPKIKTPNLDKMAENGTRFTSFYSANSVCSPSRAALLTGCYPPRTGVTTVLFPRNKNGLNKDVTTIAQMLKQKDYATSCIGKWHLGHLPGHLPTDKGFDEYYGIPYSNDMTIDPNAALAKDIVLRDGFTLEKMKNVKPSKNKVPLMRNSEVVEYPADQTLLTQRYTAEALKFIRKNKENPFFLYLPHTMPHIPLFASEKFKGKSERGLYGDTIEEIDWSVGEILGTLDELKLSEKTMVVYTSDNGPWQLPGGRGGCAFPLRGFKFGTYEGGMRVPCLMQWPGTIPAGKVCDELISTIDMYPTIAGLAGISTEGQTLDGLDVFGLMTGKTKSPREEFCYFKGTGIQAFRSGKWKLRKAGRKAELFNLEEDISEKTNLAETNPELVDTLSKRMAELQAAIRSKK